MAQRPPTPSLPSPLNADPARQATPLFKGVDYQIWHTVLAWSDLTDEQILVVEGMEDFDVIGSGIGIGTQIKALTKPISLRSAPVVEAIRNFWVGRHSNRTKTIELRLLTTADLSIEAGEPFGPNRSGLALWNSEAKRAIPCESSLLQQFLITDPSVSAQLAAPFPSEVPPLVGFITSISAETFHRECIQRISWLLNEPSVDEVREAARLKLHAFGEQMGLLPRDSDQAMERLFRHIAEIGMREHRELTRAEFRVLFDEATRISVPASFVNAQASKMAAQLQLSTGSAAQEAYLPPEPFLLPGLPNPCMPREELVTQLAKSLSEHTFLALQGSTGKGKSTMAKLVAKKSGSKWGWANMSHLRPEQRVPALRNLNRQVASWGPAPTLILDDFAAEGADSKALLQELAVLKHLVCSRRGRLIVTTQRRLGSSFRRHACLPPEVEHNVSSLRKEEIRAFCRQSGCPDDARLSPWVNIINAHTGGHPQLVHAQTSVLASRHWPMPTTTEITAIPPEVTEERQQARQLLSQLDPGEVELLYRLSLAFEPFRKDQAVVVAEIRPALSRAGDKFDKLLGPWIEPAGGRYFRLSSLLTRAAQENWTPDRLKVMRKEYAKAIRRAGECTLLEASEGLFQAIMARDAELAGTVLAPLMLVAAESRKLLAQALGWVPLIGADESLFQDKPIVAHLLRVVQFRNAVAGEDAAAPKLAEALFNSALRSLPRELDLLIRVGAASEILLAIRVLVAPELLLRSWLNFTQLAAEDGQIGAIARSIEQYLPTGNVRLKVRFDELLFSFILARRGGKHYLMRLINAIEQLEGGERKLIIEMLRSNRTRLSSFIDGVWINELADQSPDWTGCIDSLRTAWKAGGQWGVPCMVDMSARGIAAIQDEHLGLKEAALETLATAATELGSDALMLRSQRAMLHHLHGEHEAAYKTWVSTLDDWSREDHEAALPGLFAFANCGASAGLLEWWSEAASTFEQARVFALAVNRQLDALQFAADAAYCLWRAGKRSASVRGFAECLRTLETLESTASPDEFHTQWKLTEHLINWCAVDSGVPTHLPVATPRPGICSEVKSTERHQLLKTLPRGPILLSWFRLAEAELSADVGTEAFASLCLRSDVDAYPGLQPLIAFLRVQRALHEEQWKELPQLGYAAGLANGQARVPSSDSSTLFKPVLPANPTQPATGFGEIMLREVLFAALLFCTSRGKVVESLIDIWQVSTVSDDCRRVMTPALTSITTIMSADPLSAYRYYETAGDDRFTRLLAALSMAHNLNATPEMCFVGLATLVTDDGLTVNYCGSHRTIGALTRNLWLQRIQFPAELNSPRLTIPAIQTAASGITVNLASAAKILLAAIDAVSVNTPPSLRSKLKRLAGE